MFPMYISDGNSTSSSDLRYAKMLQLSFEVLLHIDISLGMSICFKLVILLNINPNEPFLEPISPKFGKLMFVTDVHVAKRYPLFKVVMLSE